MGHSSSDEELSDWRKEDLNFTMGMIKSEKKVDRRMVDIYRLKKLHQHMGNAKNFASTMQALKPENSIDPLGLDIFDHSGEEIKSEEGPYSVETPSEES